MSLAARQPSTSSQAAAPAGTQQGIYLVLPFENTGASPRLDWLGEGLEELTIQRLSAAGQQVYSHAGRANELDRYGLPASAKLSRAAMLHMAEDLDADFVIFGTFTSDGKNLTVESRILRVNVVTDRTGANPTALLAPVRESGPLNSLIDLHLRLIWRLLSANDHTYPLSLVEFSKAQRPLRLDAFEHYIRGLLASEDEARLRELREAARLDPDWPDPDFALGQAYYVRRDCNSALPWFARVPTSHQRHVESVFASGVCRLLLNQPDRAEQIFIALQDTLRNNGVAGVELPEILNNLAIARERQGKTPLAQTDLRRASEIDPDEDDYPFNLGLLALRASDFATAAGYFREASQREPDNPEDRALLIQSLEKAGKKEEAEQEREAAKETLGEDAVVPAIHLEGRTRARGKTQNDTQGDALTSLERIKTELDALALRLEVETLEPPTSASATDAVSGTPAAHVRRGRQELTAGRLDTAESEFRAALKVDASDPGAHRGLAEIDRRHAKLDDAVRELQASLEARDSAVVRTMLAKIYLEQKKPELARTEAERALKLAPNYSEAKQLLEHLQNTKPGGAAQ
ncbi:MAG TPA: tetratricopeptide repeat protein [Candidatus Acidoferrum sp.]|nr:tetratricopeptide repeat protein [Candidatus Acidoferrum sp.]